jgi:hypothetical protein
LLCDPQGKAAALGSAAEGEAMTAARDTYNAALATFADSQFDCGDHRADDEETYEQVNASAKAAEVKLSAALEALIVAERADLLTACKVMAIAVDSQTGHISTGAAQDAARMARAAIAQAEGQP